MTLVYNGTNGFYWTAVASSRYDDDRKLPSAYIFYLGSSVNPSRGPDVRWYAFPLRS